MNDSALAYETNNYSPRLAEFYDPPAPRWPTLLEQLEAAAAAGFGWVVIDGGSLAAQLRRGSTLADLRRVLAALGLRCLALSEVSIVEEAAAVFAEARPLLDAVRALDAPFLQASVMGSRRQCRASARALEQLVAANGATLALEFLPFSSVDSIEAALRFVVEAELCNTRLLIDCWHFFQADGRWESLRRLRREQIAYLQFSDHAGIGVPNPLHATVNERLLPGEGVFELARFCAELRRCGFAGVLSSEVLSNHWRTRSPADYARAEFAAASRYWGNACSD